MRSYKQRAVSYGALRGVLTGTFVWALAFSSVASAQSLIATNGAIAGAAGNSLATTRPDTGPVMSELQPLRTMTHPETRQPTGLRSRKSTKVFAFMIVRTTKLANNAGGVEPT